ncbi:MAG: hypothetical protein M1479_08050 [Actinobacteria bacterium]|nr:hypothetical protein [Actinomycetota bacterium]
MYKKTVLNIAYIITVIIVFFLVFIAIYTNFDKFCSKKIIKYTQISIEDGTKIDDLVSKYTTEEDKEDFIRQIKKVNKLNDNDAEYIAKKSLIIPVIKSQ